MILCQNGGTENPIFFNGTESAEVNCQCLYGFTGRYCEIDAVAYEPVHETVFKISLCVFFLLILPSIVLYSIRTCYLALKRSGAIEVEPRNNVSVKFMNQPTYSGYRRPRQAFRTISLPVSATIIMMEPMMLEDMRRLHKTVSLQNRRVILEDILEADSMPNVYNQNDRNDGEPSSKSPPPPPYSKATLIP